MPLLLLLVLTHVVNDAPDVWLVYAHAKSQAGNHHTCVITLECAVRLVALSYGQLGMVPAPRIAVASLRLVSGSLLCEWHAQHSIFRISVAGSSAHSGIALCCVFDIVGSMANRKTQRGSCKTSPTSSFAGTCPRQAATSAATCTKAA
jgi:hypothetical protein